jgi:hypothetical protein
MIRHLKSKQQWLAEQGIEYLFVLAPSKHYIYPEKLPDHIVALNKTNLSDQLAEELNKHPTINFVYLKPHLIEAKQRSSELLYYKADSHWNYDGANVAQYVIAKKLRELFAERIMPNKDLMKSVELINYQGDHSRYMGIEAHFEESSKTPKLDDCTVSNKPDEANFNKTFTTKCLNSGLTTVVFRDSFFTNLQPFISSYFDQATFIWSKMKFKTAKLWINKDKPDVIIEEWVDRYLPNTYSPY